ncbi:hypothetical protein [Aquitalea aquatica]|uniref:Uncharacterized protein n=1 Tax=Aquitalea aquatica TaxID=3044273 RepID=A0A838Y0W7_9NEIS|nr:hypothetical protein [Aquitalea magnusonii]MBA4707548.1 hypothetical protein [Aquitalea magnusonii]
MKPNIIDVLLIAVIETTLAKLEQDNAKLREQVAGYDRLRTAHENVKARNAVLEEQVSILNRSLEWNYQERQSLETRVRQMQEKVASYVKMDSYYGGIERQNEELKEQVLELGRKNIALAAEAESAQQLEQQLATADQRIRELESALAVASLPAASRANVIALIQEQAA